MNIDEERYFVSLGMRTWAGSFFRALGEAIAHADVTNLKVIKSTWNKAWMEYLEIGKKEHDKNK